MSNKDNLAIIIDARCLRTYAVGLPGFHGGTEGLVKVLAHGLAKQGHIVHVLTPDLIHEEQRGTREWWWPEAYHPCVADVAIAVHSLQTIGDLSAPILVMVPNGIDPPLNGAGDMVDCFATFSKVHTDMMSKRLGIDPERCFVTGLGVDLNAIRTEKRLTGARRVPGRMLYCNDPARGLWHVLDIFDKVREKVPHASLNITYDFDRQIERFRWQANSMAELMLETKRRIETTRGVTSVGALSGTAMLDEQRSCHVHVMPSDPPNQGSQIHGLAQMELAAAGVPLVLSDIEAFPEVFGEAATILPLPGMMRAKRGDDIVRVDAQDWADVTVRLMEDSKRWKASSDASLALADKNGWSNVLDRWAALLSMLVARVTEAQEVQKAA